MIRRAACSLAVLLAACSDGAATLDAGAARDAAPADAAAPPADSGISGPRDAAAADAGPGPTDSGPSGADATPGDAGTSTASPCARGGCRDRIDSDAEFEALSRLSPDGACQFDRELWIVLSASATSPIQDTYYVDANRHPQLIDFVRGELGARYAALDVEAYFRAFEREDTREQRVGRIRRLTPVAGQTTRYAVDLFQSEYFAVEPLTVPQIQALIDHLARTFALPLGYAPGLEGAIRAARALTNPTFALHLPELCPTEVCPAGAGPCVILPDDGELCGHFIDNRTIEQERAQQMRVQLAPGNHRLARGARLPLIVGGTFGPSQAPIVINELGRVLTQDVGGQTYWSIEQPATVGGQSLLLRVDVPNPNAPLVLREPFIDYTSAYASIAAGTPAESAVHLGSCTESTLPRYYAEADLGGGDRVRLEYRHAVPFGGSGRLLPTRADVVLGGQRVTVTDYFGLVYAGVHHNWNNQFQIVFEAPVRYQGHDVHGLWIDEPGTSCCPVDSIRTIDASGRAVDTLTPLSYVRSPRTF